MVRVEKEKVDLRNDKERIAYLEHLCENIKEAKKQCEDIKFEYGQVTSYLKDIQLIDRAPKEEQEKLLAAAKQIVELTKERKKSQKQEYKFTEAQRRAMDNYEDVVEDDIKKLKAGFIQFLKNIIKKIIVYNDKITVTFNLKMMN